MNLNRGLIARIALVMAIACVLLNVVSMIKPFNTYGIDSFLLSGTMILLALSFKGDETKRTMFICCVVAAILGLASGIMALVGVV